MATAGHNLSVYDKDRLPSAAGLRFGLVMAQWNREITEALCSGAKEALLDLGARKEDIHVQEVPGSFELVYGAKWMARNHKPDAILVIGSVIQGETRHFDFVCDAVSQGVKDLNILLDIPVIFCVLTDNTREQALARSGGIHGNKGVEAAVAALQMATLGR